jgi:ArsR family transcriptional regulator
METETAVQVLAALAQDTRLEALRVLVAAGPSGMAAGELAKHLDIPSPTLSFHLKAMRHAELIACQRTGRSLLYSANFETLQSIVGYLTSNCCSNDSAASCN